MQSEEEAKINNDKGKSQAEKEIYCTSAEGETNNDKANSFAMGGGGGSEWLKDINIFQMETT